MKTFVGFVWYECTLHDDHVAGEYKGDPVGVQKSTLCLVRAEKAVWKGSRGVWERMGPFAGILRSGF